jgi:hypothetical protein
MQILATIPTDLGKSIIYGHNKVMLVRETECEDCSNAAKYVLRGDTDAFGFEPVVLCGPCTSRAQARQQVYEAAVHVDERQPKPKHVFLVSERTNHDGKGDWCMEFQSFRQATAFYRKIAAEAAPWGGLHPDKGVREILKVDAARVLQAFAQSYADY